MKSNITCLRAVALVFIAGLLGFEPAVYARAADLKSIHKFSIPAQSLDTALLAFSDQAKVQVLMQGGAKADAQSSGAVGELISLDALTAILRNTGFRYQQIDRETVAIVAAGSQLSKTSINADKEMRPIRVAQSGPPSPQDSGQSSRSSTESTQNSKNQSTPSSEGKENESKLEQVVVTGTNIRGEEPVGSPLKVYTREDLDQSGAATLDQFGRQMPENFSSADTISNFASNSQFTKFSNGGGGAFAGAGFDLHGLGASATLTLLNGHRLAGGNIDGSFVDISQIPLSIVDRIEVLPDGASAIYGADAVAGVVNIITRKDFDGAQSEIRYAGATAGGAVEITGSQLLGHSWGSGNFLLNYEYDKQDGLDASQRDYIGDQGGPFGLIPQNRRNSVFVSGSQNVGADTTISGDAIYSERNHLQQVTDNGSYPSIGQLLQGAVLSGSTRQSGLALTVDHALFSDWHLDLHGNYSRVRQANTEVSSVAFPALNFNEIVSTFTGGNSDEAGTDALLNGSLVELPGGPVKAAVGASYRWEKFFGPFDQENSGEVSHLGQPRPLQRDVTSLYGELFIPLVGHSNTMAGIRRLEVSVSARYDDYTDFGSTSNPKFGLLWEPITGLDIRGTYGTSFKAPELENLGLIVTSETSVLADPSAVSGFTDTLLLGGGNPNLTAEKSRSFSVGLDLKPTALPLFSFAATYFHIVFNDRIATAPLVGEDYLSDPALAPFVTRNPPLSEVQAYFNSPTFTSDGGHQGPAGVKAIFDNRYANIAATRESGLDLTAGYAIPTDYGRFNVSLAADRLFENSFQPAPLGPSVALLNTFGQTPRLKGRGAIAWTQGRLAALVSVNYINSYDNTLTTPTQKIGAWTTADVNLSYKTGTAVSAYWLRNLTIALNVQNITDAKPPYVSIPDVLIGQNPIPFDPANASPVGRLIALQLSKLW